MPEVGKLRGLWSFNFGSWGLRELVIISVWSFMLFFFPGSNVMLLNISTELLEEKKVKRP